MSIALKVSRNGPLVIISSCSQKCILLTLYSTVPVLRYVVLDQDYHVFLISNQ